MPPAVAVRDSWLAGGRVSGEDRFWNTVSRAGMALVAGE
jgi:hypothetical protein